ncbi:MAG: sterol desaturase family protein [Nevskiales bacterium]
MLTHEAVIRLSAFIGVLLVLALAERLWPRRGSRASRTKRWFANLGLVALATLLVRVALPTAVVAWALTVEQRAWGLFNLIALPAWLEVGLAVALLDLAIYLQHRVVHHLPVLWRLHRVHHSDLDFDVTTGVRFHPIELFLSILWKLVAITVLGASPMAALIFEVLLSAASLWEHANLRLPETLERRLRRVIVTPDMHRIHHSVLRDERDSNYGFCLSCWDRWLRSYTPAPRDGQAAMSIGLNGFREQQKLNLWRLLWQPLQPD